MCLCVCAPPTPAPCPGEVKNNVGRFGRSRRPSAVSGRRRRPPAGLHKAAAPAPALSLCPHNTPRFRLPPPAHPRVTAPEEGAGRGGAARWPRLPSTQACPFLSRPVLTRSVEGRGALRHVLRARGLQSAAAGPEAQAQCGGRFHRGEEEVELPPPTVLCGGCGAAPRRALGGSARARLPLVPRGGGAGPRGGGGGGSG